MTRKLVILAVIVAALATAEASTSPAEAKGNRTVISGGDLPHPITIPFEDDFALAYRKSPNVLWDQFPDWPVLVEPPVGDLGFGYEMRSDLYGVMLYEAVYGSSGQRLEQPALEQSAERSETTYYPAASTARIHVEPGSVELWVKLDAERARLIERYIELGRAGLLSEEPSILEVHAAAAQLTGRFTPVEVDGRPMTANQLETFWDLVASERWRIVPLRTSRAGAVEFTNTERDYQEMFEAQVYGYPHYIAVRLISEGRGVELAYYPGTDAVAGMPPPAYNTGLGMLVPPNLAERFAAALGIERPAAAVATSEVAQTASQPVEAKPRLASTGLAALVVALGVAVVLATAGTLVRYGRANVSEKSGTRNG